MNRIKVKSGKDAFEIVKQVFIPMFYNESQIGRSFREKNEEEIYKFKKRLFESILELTIKVDDNTIKNKNIRDKILEINQNTCGSIGQAQKVVNVYLKYYSILRNKNMKILKELDCPLDSKIMSRYSRQFGLKKISLRQFNDMNTYEVWQELLRKNGKGFRLRADLETYDPERIKQFFQ